MKKQDIVVTLRRELRAVMQLRQITKENAATLSAVCALKRFQSARMAATHADLLASSESSAAAQFFLSDLYGATDLTRRDAEIERIIPMMERLLPLSALQVITEAIMLDALSESLDSLTALHLGETVSEEQYVAVYPNVTRRDDRVRQIEYIRSIGTSLCDLVRTPLLGSTLRMMRAPAKVAGLSELHDFLERGFTAFKRMRRPELFVATIVAREMMILENLYTHRPHPFSCENLAEV